MFLEYWLPLGLYYKAVSGLADDLEGVWVECAGQFVSLVFLDKNFITQFNAGGTGPVVYDFISFTLSFLFSVMIMYFMVISMVDASVRDLPHDFSVKQ